MGYTIRTERRPVTGLDGTFHILEDPAGGARAEIWPALGFNCLRWQAAWKGQRLDLLYADPQLFDNLKPTRSGIPILFPFPNRIRDGQFTWDGKSYPLPPNDPSGKNAIHGFACRHSWRVVGQGADAQAAWVAGEFQGSVDAPEARPLWPADYRLRITYRLSESALRVEATADNPDRAALPFGLGFHPYLRVPLTPNGKPEHCLVEARARQAWELVDSLPTGSRQPLDPARALLMPKPYTDLALDNLWTDLDSPTTAGLRLLGRVTQEPDGVRVRVHASPDFRELVVFTAPHRQAFCLEPYTCTTDAINLQQRGIDAGWRVLQPGESWTGAVVLELEGRS